MTEMVKIRGDSRALFPAAQRFSKEAVQQSANWSPETLWQGMEDRFHRALWLWGGSSEWTPRFFSKLSCWAKKWTSVWISPWSLNTIPSREKKNAPFIVSFFFLPSSSSQAIQGFSVKNQLVLFTVKDLCFVFILGGGGEGEGRRPMCLDRAGPAYCNKKIECNKSYKSLECIDSLESYID